MKKLFLLTILTALSICVVSAQTNYYAVSKNIAVSGGTYKCVNKYGVVRLYATTTWQAETDIAYTDGSKFPPFGTPMEDAAIRPAGTHDKIKGIVYGILTSAEEERIKGDEITIDMYFDTQGNIQGVEFHIMAFNFEQTRKGFCTIPPEQYRKIENAIKAQIKYTITAEGKKRNYIIGVWEHSPK